MRKALLAVTPTIARLALIMSLLISGYAIAGLLHLVPASRGRVVAPDTGFLLAILLVFGAGSLSLFGVGAAVRRRPSRDLGLRVLVMAAAYALMIALFARSDLSQPFYGLISTLGDFLLLLAFQVLGLLALALMCLLPPPPSDPAHPNPINDQGGIS